MGIWKPGGHNTSGHRLPLIIHIGIVLTLALGAAWGLWRLWSGTWALELTQDLNDQSRFEVAKIVLAIVGGLGGVAFLTIGYRKQRHGEAAERRNDAAEARDQARHFHERFSAAADQLGSDAPRIRLAGVYAMAALADDWDAGRQTCINVLCGYIRAPYEPPGSLDWGPTSEDLSRYRAATEEREIRRAIIDTIGERLRTEPVNAKTWHGHRYDLTGAILDTGDLTGIMVTPGTVIDLTRTRFPIGTVDFARARFSAGTVNFQGAAFNGGTVNFTHTEFSGSTIDFQAAAFNGGTLNFQGAAFNGGTVNFTHAEFKGSTIDFQAAAFNGGTVDFWGAVVRGGTIDFARAMFQTGGTVNFTRGIFIGGTVNFTYPEFSGGVVDFTFAEFSGGTIELVWLRSGSVPPVFDDFPDGPPDGLKLPPSM